MVRVRETIPEDLAILRYCLRAEDKREIINYGLTPERAIYASYRITLEPMTVLIDDKIAAVYGCSGAPICDVGKPWVLTTALCDDYPLQFALFYRQEVRKMLVRFPVLENIVDATHEKAIKLLELIGFTIYPAEPMGPKGELFSKFRMVI